MITGDRIEISKEELAVLKVSDHPGMHFIKKCMAAGYTPTGLYPVYYQGWELDEWAASATKDGKKYWLTTNHNALEAEEMPSFSIKRFIGTILRKIW